MKSVPLIGFDVGFGQTKGVSDSGHELCVPSWTARVNDNAMALDRVNLIVDEKVHWLVGDDAHRLARARLPEVDSSWYRQPEFRVLTRYILEQMGTRSARVVTGLPVRYHAEHKEHLQKTLQSWSSSGINLEVLRIIPQPVGSYFYLAMDDAGNAQEGFANTRVGIVDIGGGTVDAIELNHAKVSWTVHASEPRGVSRAYEYLHSYIRGKGIAARIADMPSVMAAGQIRDGKQVLSLERPIAEAKRLVVQAVADIVIDLWTNATSLDALIVTGGGAALCRDELVKEFSKARIMIPDAPHLANARGYLRAARHYAGQRSGARSASA